MTVSPWKTRLWAVILCAAAFLAAAGAFALALEPGERPVRVLGQRGEPEDTAARFFNALCLREWDAASWYVWGAPELALDREPEGDLERLVWRAYQQSWSWSLESGGKIDSVSAWQRVRFTSLRPELLSEGLTGEVQALLALRVDAAEDLSQVYDPEGQFLPSVVEEALTRALEARLTEPWRYTDDTVLTLRLSYRDDRWQILPSEELWEALSGGEGGTL